MAQKEKTERNIKMYLDKFGFKKLGDVLPSRPTKSYRHICADEEISLKRAQDIINKYREEYGPDRDE